MCCSARASPEDFNRMTNCPPWNLGELVVHIAMSIHLGDDEVPAATPDSGVLSAADYYRRPERDTPDYRQSNVDRAKQVASGVVATTPAARWFGEVLQDTVLRLSRLDLGRLVEIPGCGPMKLADWVVTRVISVAAHGLDVALTLSVEPWTRWPSLGVIRPVLVSLLGAEPPAGLCWDDQTLLAAGTGRRALTGHERALLGSLADRFPLLSWRRSAVQGAPAPPARDALVAACADVRRGGLRRTGRCRSGLEGSGDGADPVDGAPPVAVVGDGAEQFPQVQHGHPTAPSGIERAHLAVAAEELVGHRRLGRAGDHAEVDVRPHPGHGRVDEGRPPSVPARMFPDHRSPWVRTGPVSGTSSGSRAQSRSSAARSLAVSAWSTAGSRR